MQLDKARVLPIVRAALKEDIGRGDITTALVIDRFSSTKALITTRQDCIVCGLRVAELVMSTVDYSVRFKPNCDDGASVGAGKEIAFIEGNTCSILRAERTMLNFLTLLSGIATRTRQYKNKAAPYGVKIMDTRKTIPLLRYLEKYAVFIGGGTNHRMGLYDQVLIKDNHIYCRRRSASSSCEIPLKEIVEEARKKSPRGAIIEIEVSTLAEFSDALCGKPDIIMLDNLSVKDARACVEIRRLSNAETLVEASGGITLETIEEYAKTEVDMISVGELTDSVAAIDMSLDLV